MRVLERTGVYRLDTFWPVRESPHRSSHGARWGLDQSLAGRRCRRSLIKLQQASKSVTANATAGSSGHVARRNTEPRSCIFVGVGGLCAFAPASPVGITLQDTTLVHGGKYEN